MSFYTNPYLVQVISKDFAVDSAGNAVKMSNRELARAGQRRSAYLAEQLAERNRRLRLAAAIGGGSLAAGGGTYAVLRNRNNRRYSRAR